MTSRSLVSRVVIATVSVAMLAALAGIGSAAVIARSLWHARERQMLHDVATGLVDAIRREALHHEMDHAAAEAIRESVTTGYRLEVWRGSTLVAASAAGPQLGPPAAPGWTAPPTWLVDTQPFDGGMLVLAAIPKERGEQVGWIVWRSLLLSAPIVLALAFLIGRLVGMRAARPLLDFKDRIVSAEPLAPWPQAVSTATTREVQQLENSFREVWERLRDAVSRELEFAANASHELRTPLTRIRLHSERARGAGGPGANELDHLIAEVDRMVRLVDSLLILSRDVGAGIPALEVVNLSDILAMTSRRVFAGAAAPETCAPDEALVRGDEALLAIAVENLLDNARKFGALGRSAKVYIRETDARVTLEVASPGAPTPAASEQLFERFYRSPDARTNGAGHGLGLPLARHIARLHGGDVRCVSAPGEDARFELALPVWTPSISG